jgi:muramoyltetrapeptide carboxypeptidase
MQPTRRQFVAASAAATATVLPAGPALAQGQPQSSSRLPVIRPPRLRAGDTLALVNPSGAIYERAPYEIATESLQALGFKVREAPHLRARRGHLAGTDAQRASDVNAMFADPGVHGILAMTGGSGGNRILPLLDYAAIRRTPKFLGGFSDTTALINAVNARTGLVTFHGPVGVVRMECLQRRTLARRGDGRPCADAAQPARQGRQPRAAHRPHQHAARRQGAGAPGGRQPGGAHVDGGLTLLAGL